MKRATILLLLGLSAIPLCPQATPAYEPRAVAVLPTGNREGQVGYEKSFSEGGGYAGPSDFTFSPAGDLYVSDHVNSKTDVFDQDFRFIRTVRIKEFGEYPVINRLELDPVGRMLAVVDLGGLYLIDKDGKILFAKKQWELPRAVTSRYDAFLYGEGILYSNGSSNYHILDKDGRELPEAKKAAQWDSMASDISRLYESDKGAATSIVNDLRAAGIVWDHGRLLTTDFARQRKLWGQLRKLTVSGRTAGQDPQVLDTVSDATFLGFDAEANSYWMCFEKARFNSRFVLIMSPLGEVIDHFTTEILKRARPVVAPTGDIYFMIAGENGVSISRIEKGW